MLWEVELRPLGRDVERERVCDEFDLLTHSDRGADLIAASSRGFLLEGELNIATVQHLAAILLTDPIIESATVRRVGEGIAEAAITVLYRPGVMDPVAQSVRRAAADLSLPLRAVRTFRRYYPPAAVPTGTPRADETGAADRELLLRKILANEAIEQIVIGPLRTEHFSISQPYRFQRISIPLRDLDDGGLMSLSTKGQLALTLEEMRAIQSHFREIGRDPTDCELETIAQTWSEHCSHKTLKGAIEYNDNSGGTSQKRRYENLLKETIFAATQTIRARLGENDWCVSVFTDNAGIIRWSEDFHVCFKVETHNRPSAIEPYGGANTGLGGVIRDVLGTGLGGRPIANTDVFCFARPDYPPEQLPPGVLHPRRVIQGVVAGVRDYGNRMGIPTVNGTVVFDDRYLANPLVFCGTIGLIPWGLERKSVSPGQLIVVVGGRTGRDGIHGATFSSLGLTEESETISGGAVQIGNAIEEKKLVDVILQARDRRLYSAITDCGAGGFSSAVGEMAAETGVEVDLDAAPLKYDGLSYTEIWISESQERMVLAVPPEHWPALQALCAAEDVEAAVLGRFTDSGRLLLRYQGEVVADLAMQFLHRGRPKITREAVWQPATPHLEPAAFAKDSGMTCQEGLFAILSSLSVCSKEWIIRQYDHEVQAGSVIKPLVGIDEDGPSDAAVLMPVLGRWEGVAVSNGLNPRYGDLDPYVMAAAAIDEAVRNLVAVGGDPGHTAILDNFCWGNVHDAALLGALVRAAEGCRDTAVAYGTPFISGKDSLNNEYRSADRHVTIPHTLLISAIARVPDVRRCVTMDLKTPGNRLLLVGLTREELGGSHWNLVTGRSGGVPPMPDLQAAPAIFRAVHEAIQAGLVRACHDLSEGGLAVAIAEMAFAGGVGADLTRVVATPGEPALSDEVRLFSESSSRFLLEVRPADLASIRSIFDGIPWADIGETVAAPRLRIAGASGAWLIDASLSELKMAWQRPLRW